MAQYRTEIGTAEVCDMLCRLGATANYRGFSYTAYAVLLCVQQQDRLLLVTKWLYPDVAKRYGTNWKAVLFWTVPPHDPGRGQAEIWRERKFR